MSAAINSLHEQILQVLAERGSTTAEYLQLVCDRGTPAEVTQALRELQAEHRVEIVRHPSHGSYLLCRLVEACA